MKRLYLRMIMAYLCVSVFGITEASAANWQVVAEVEQTALYVDIDSVRKNPDNMTFWSDGRITDGLAAGIQMVCLIEVASSQGKMLVRDLQCNHYVKKEMILRTDKAGPWETVVPGSVMEDSVRLAAKYAR